MKNVKLAKYHVLGVQHRLGYLRTTLRNPVSQYVPLMPWILRVALFPMPYPSRRIILSSIEAFEYKTSSANATAIQLRFLSKHPVWLNCAYCVTLWHERVYLTHGLTTLHSIRVFVSHCRRWTSSAVIPLIISSIASSLRVLSKRIYYNPKNDAYSWKTQLACSRCSFHLNCPEHSGPESKFLSERKIRQSQKNDSQHTWKGPEPKRISLYWSLKAFTNKSSASMSCLREYLCTYWNWSSRESVQISKYVLNMFGQRETERTTWGDILQVYCSTVRR